MLMRMQAIVYIKLRAEYAESKAASGLEVVVPMPPEVSRLACDHATEVTSPPHCVLLPDICSPRLAFQQAAFTS